MHPLVARNGPRRADLSYNILLLLVAAILILILPATAAAAELPNDNCRLWHLKCLGGREMGCCKWDQGRKFYSLSARCLYGDCYMNKEQDSAECPSPEKAAADAAAQASASAAAAA